RPATWAGFHNDKRTSRSAPWTQVLGPCQPESGSGHLLAAERRREGDHATLAGGVRDRHRYVGAGPGQPGGDLEQLSASGASGLTGSIGEPDLGAPAAEVVREGGDHGPGAVG